MCVIFFFLDLLATKTQRHKFKRLFEGSRLGIRVRVRLCQCRVPRKIGIQGLVCVCMIRRVCLLVTLWVTRAFPQSCQLWIPVLVFSSNKIPPHSTSCLWEGACDQSVIEFCPFLSDVAAGLDRNAASSESLPSVPLGILSIEKWHHADSSAFICHSLKVKILFSVITV